VLALPGFDRSTAVAYCRTGRASIKPLCNGRKGWRRTSRICAPTSWCTATKGGLHPHEVDDIDQLCINTIRTLAIDAVEAAGSGHPRTPMALAPVAYVLWTRFLSHDPENPEWADRNRFVLSAGHASRLLYCLLHLTGYDLPLEGAEAVPSGGDLQTLEERTNSSGGMTRCSSSKVLTA
jgi:hypothetical protein